ncbi:MAG: twin-arginine translocation signal domain-containing protein [Betaproteobacteria bacterium]|nr:twin-arginine translocation signal domain-containing protein [Betaproteobacteria bacterium]
MTFNRRDFLKMSGAAAAGALYGCAGGTRASGNVVVIGGGYGGATAAKYIRMWSNGGINVTLVERNPAFVSCPISNLVLSGDKTMADITTGYDGLKKHGVRVVQGDAVAVDPVKRTVKLGNGQELSYDRLVVSPGIDFMFESVPGLTPALADSKILHAWKAGPQTVALRKQLEDMKDGGVFAIAIPKAPYRCPPGPYERACVVAEYFKTKKPKSKLLILDANEDVVSKKGLFMKAWGDLYKGIIEYRPNHVVTQLDANAMTLKFEFADAVKADVLNVIPGQMAGGIAKAAGLITANNRWCGIDWRTMESVTHKNIHVLGDSTLSAPAMPKSGHMTTQHAKIAAGAIVALMSGEQAPDPMVIANTCYSFVNSKNTVHVASVHTYDAKDKTFKTVPGSGGLSSAANEQEAKYAMAWARNVWADALL